MLAKFPYKVASSFYSADCQTFGELCTRRLQWDDICLWADGHRKDVYHGGREVGARVARYHP